MADASFESENVREAREDERFVVDVDGFEGPLDLLLELARRQKVDLQKISVLALAEQYLTFIEAARKVRLELAADYLVMAAWLAYLKSRLLLPKTKTGEEPEAGDLASRMSLRRRVVWSLAEAREARQRLVGEAGDWTALDGFLVDYCVTPELVRTVRASSFSATLEMVKEKLPRVTKERAPRVAKAARRLRSVWTRARSAP